jgi:hypothetical protein
MATAGKAVYAQFTIVRSIHRSSYNPKMKDGITKSLLQNWQLIANFFIAHLPILVKCKPKAQSECTLLHNWQLGA